MNLRDAVTGTDDKAIVAEVERGEDHIKEQFEMAMIDNDLSTETKTLISQCYDSVKQGHDQMRDLKNGLQGSRSTSL